MRLDVRHALTTMAVAGGVAWLTSWLVSRVTDNMHVASALAIGLGLGASRLFVAEKRS